MDSSPTSTLGCFGCFRKVNQRTARSYISSGYYGTNGFKYLPVNGQGHLTTNGANGAVTAGPRPTTLSGMHFKGSPPLNGTGASSPQYVSIDQASEMSRRAIVDNKRSMLYVQRNVTTSGTNDSGIGRSSGRELSDESFSRHQLTYANVHKSSKPLYPSILHPALQEQLSLSASSSPGGCRVPRRASANQIAQAAPRGTGTPQRSTSQRFDPAGAKAALMMNNQNSQHQPPVPIHRDHVRRSSYLSNESSETGSDENNADSTLAREMALLKLELEMVRLECESIMRQQARANSYSHLNKQHCNGRCCYHQHGGAGGPGGGVYGEVHIYDDVHTYSRGPRPAFSHNYVNVPYVTPFGGLGHGAAASQGLPGHATRFNATPIDVLRLRQRSSSASPSRFGRGVSESHSMMDMPRRVTSPSPSPLVHGDVHGGHHLQQQQQSHSPAGVASGHHGPSSHSHHGGVPAGIQSVAAAVTSHRQPTASSGQSYLYRPHRSCSNPAIKRIEDQPPLPPREHFSHNSSSSVVFGSGSPSIHGAVAPSHGAHPCSHSSAAIPGYPYKHSRSRSHGGGFQQYQNHFQQSIPTVQEQSGSSREQLDDCSSDDSRSVTPVAEYEGHSLPSTPGTQSPCPASEPIAGPHARRPMGTPGPPSVGGSIPQQQIHHQRATQPTAPHYQHQDREHRPKWDREREQQIAHYNSPSSNCNSPRYSRERTVDEANESMHDMMHLLAHLDETRRLQSRLQMQDSLPHDPRWPINPNLNPELARDRDKLKEKIKRKRERAQKRREQQQQQLSSSPVNRTDTMSTNESEYGFLPGRHSRKSRQDFYVRQASPDTPTCEEAAEFEGAEESMATTPKQEMETSFTEDTGSRCATPVNEEADDAEDENEENIDESGLVSPSLLPSPGSGLSSPVSSGNGNSLPTPGSVITALMISSSANASPTQTILQGGGNNNGSGGLPTKDPIREHTPNVKEVKDIRDIKDILREKKAKQQALLRQQQQTATKTSIADKTVRIEQIKADESHGTMSTTL